MLFQATLTSGRGVLLLATGDIDRCIDGLSASGEHLNVHGALVMVGLIIGLIISADSFLDPR